MLMRGVWPSRPAFESPSGDFDQVRREMLRLFDEVAGDTFGSAGTGVFPPLNVTQDDDNFYVRAEVPGIKPNELSISVLVMAVSSITSCSSAAASPWASSRHCDRMLATASGCVM